MRCMDCVYFNYLSKNEQKYFTEEFGECRKKSPEISYKLGQNLGLNMLNYTFPCTSVDSWCGEFKKKDNLEG